MEAIDHSPLSSFPVCSLSQTSGGGELHIITNQHKRAFHEFFHPKALDGTFCQCLAYIGGAGQEEQSLLKIMIESFSLLNVTHLKKKTPQFSLYPTTYIQAHLLQGKVGSGNSCKHTSLQLSSCGDPRAEAEA